MLKLLPAFLLLLLSTNVSAQFSTLPQLASELSRVSGDCRLISQSSLAQLTTIELSSVPELAVRNSYEASLREMTRGEVFEGINGQAVSVADRFGRNMGYLVFPVTFLAIPEGDTDYYVIYYVFVSMTGRVEAQFQVFKPLY